MAGWIAYENGSTGSMAGSVLRADYLTLSAPGVTIDGNEFTGPDPVHTMPALVQELTDNTFSSSDTATIYLSGETVGDASLSVIGSASRYSLEDHVTVTEGASLTVAPGVEVHTQGYGYSGDGYHFSVFGSLDAGDVDFTGTTELYVGFGGEADLNNCQVAGSFVEYQSGSAGSVIDCVFDPAELRVYSLLVVEEGNVFAGSEGTSGQTDATMFSESSGDASEGQPVVATPSSDSVGDNMATGGASDAGSEPVSAVPLAADESYTATAVSVPAGTVSGTISLDTQWCDTSAPYIVDGHLAISPGATLTVLERDKRGGGA